MNIDLQARGFALTPSLDTAVRRELAKLGAPRGISRLQVRLFDVNGARGGIDKGCLVTLHWNGERRVITASDLDSDLYRAIPAAFEKLRRSMKSSLRRSRARRRLECDAVRSDLSS